jgi:alpha-N-arabinofuranosidase
MQPQMNADTRRLNAFSICVHLRSSAVPFLLLLLVIANVARAQPTIRITPDPLCGESTISPMQSGQFVEYLCDLVPAMWSEKLYDGSFEGLSPYSFVYLKETDFKEKPWYPIGQTNRAVVSEDKTSKISGEQSKKIAVEGETPCTVGISQDGVTLDAGTDIFHCWLRAKDFRGPVDVIVHRDGKVYASCKFDGLTGEWRRFSATMKCERRIEDATFTIQFHAAYGGTVWIDSASLTPEQTIGGWRPDVVQALRDLKPGVIRFGGSAVDPGDFEWKDTVGDPDRRKPFRAWGGLQEPGPGLEEFVQLCRAVNAEPFICVRFLHRTPKDAADEVEYFNGSPRTPMGALRAKNGHAEPYHIKYWQVGNEIGNAEYADQLPDFCRAMKAVDPEIRLFSSFPNVNVIKKSAEWLDYVCPHHYSTDLAWMERSIAELSDMIRTNAPPQRKIKIAVTEWNTTAGDAGPKRAMLWSLANALACSRYQNLLHRHCDLVEIANRSNLANSFCSGIIQTNRRGQMYLTPTYYAQQLYATHAAGGKPMKIEGDTGPLDISAALGGDGLVLAIFVVNDSLQEQRRKIEFQDFRSDSTSITAFTLADRDRAGELDVTNSFDDPHRVGWTESEVKESGNLLDYPFPPLSLTVLRLTTTRHGK